MENGIDASSLYPGAVLFNRYVVQERLGEGGVGVVVAALDQVLRRRVAVKCLRQTQPHSRSLALRFLREGRAIARLESTHTVRIFDARPGVLVMEYLRGLNLHQLLKARGAVPAREAVVLILQACDALAEAHELGIVHRDLKLENLFLTRRPGKEAGGYIKVLDFGLSKVLTEHTAHDDEPPTSGVTSEVGEITLTSTQCVLGSAEFMSPEQSRSSRDVDARTDIWALGVILYALLTGRSPFARRFLTQVRGAVLSGEFPPLSSLCPDLPGGLDEVVSRCLRVERDARYGSIKELATALLPFSSSRRRSMYGFSTSNDSTLAEEAPTQPSLLSRIGLGHLFTSHQGAKPKATLP
jgi:serine/threonine-protein kinase